MFIYKITNNENKMCYIGLDTHHESRQKRWKDHKKFCTTIDTKFYIALREHPKKFTYEVIDYAEKIVDLAFKEIYWIDYYNSFRCGYNSTRGGDGLNQDLSQFSEDEIQLLKQLYSITMTEYNYNTKWKNKTEAERKELTAHLHNKEVYSKKSATLTNYWKTADEETKNIQLRGLKIKWADLPKDEYEKRRIQNQLNGVKGAEQVSKKIKIEFADGTVIIYKSKSEFNRMHGYIINSILRKTKDGKTHKGMKGWEI